MEFIAKVVQKTYLDDNAVGSLFWYITKYKQSHGYIGGYNIFVDQAVYMINTVQDIYGLKGNRALHCLVSIPAKYNITEDEMYMIANTIAAMFTRHQVVFGVHNNKKNTIHAHFLINPVSFYDGQILSRELARNLFNYACKTVLGNYDC